MQHCLDRIFVIARSSAKIELPKYATDHEGQENHHGGQEQSGNNRFS
jgi:hypothetical protein